MRLIEYGPLQSNLKDPEAKWGKREGGRSMAPSDFHLAPLEEFHFERARKNVRERFSSASRMVLEWGGLFFRRRCCEDNTPNSINYETKLIKNVTSAISNRSILRFSFFKPSLQLWIILYVPKLKTVARRYKNSTTTLKLDWLRQPVP